MKEQAEQVRIIQEGTRRIEWALREVLPGDDTAESSRRQHSQPNPQPERLSIGPVAAFGHAPAKVAILFTPHEGDSHHSRSRPWHAHGASRKKGAPSKQFFEISGTPIVIHTLRVFARNQQISQIVVALRKNEMERFTRQLEKEKLGG